MKRKFTMLFALLLVCAGVMAQSSLRVSEGLLNTKEGTQYKWTSEKMTAPDGEFNKLRVTFLQNFNNDWSAGFPCVAIAEFYLYDKDGKAVTLGSERFSSNATQSGEGSIAAICDGITTGAGDAYDWYWHSQWSGTPAPYGYHYLEIDVTGLEADLNEFSIGWVTRREANSPAEIVISTGATTEKAAQNANSQMLPKVSTDFVHVYTIKSVRAKDYLTYSEESEKPVRNSSVTENGYWYFTEGTDGKVRMHNLASGKVLGTDYKMAEEGEWYISPAVYRPGVVFSKTTDITTNNCIDDQNGSIGDWKHVVGDNEGTTWLVELADVAVPMLSLQNKKIAEIGEPATAVESDQWYVLNNVGRGNYVSQEGDNWKMRATNNLAVNQSAEEKAGYLFKITKNGEYYNIVSGNGKYFKLGSNTASTSASPVNFEIDLIGESANNFYIFDKDNGYAADGQESGNNFVGWSAAVPTSAGGNDSYRLLPIVLAERNATDDLRTLIAEIEAMGIEGSDIVGYYSVASVNALNEAVDAAQALVDADNVTDEDVATLQAALDDLEVVLPEAGKFYRIMNDGGTGYLSTGTGTGRTQFVAGIGELASSVFYYTGTKLVDYTTGLYLVSANGNRLSYTETVGEAVGTTIAFAESPVVGKLLISFNDGNRSFYSNGTGQSDAATPGQTGEHYRFTVTEVEWLPVAINATVGYATFYSPVELKLSQNRVKAYTGKVEGSVLKLTEQTVVPANTGVILELQEGAEVENGYTFLQVKETTLTGLDNDLTGTFAKTYVTDDAYVLANGSSGVGLYKASMNFNDGVKVEEGGTAWLNNGFKAYLPAPVGAQAAMFSFGRGDGGTTGIDGSVLEAQGSQHIYDLAGRRVAKMEKGIYIVNGRKVVIR